MSGFMPVPQWHPWSRYLLPCSPLPSHSLSALLARLQHRAVSTLLRHTFSPMYHFYQSDACMQGIIYLSRWVFRRKGALRKFGSGSQALAIHYSLEVKCRRFFSNIYRLLRRQWSHSKCSDIDQNSNHCLIHTAESKKQYPAGSLTS